MRILLLGLFLADACSGHAAELQRYVFEKAEMASVFRITLYAENEKLAKDAAEAAFARVEELNAALSDYEPESEISRLSRTAGSGRAVPVSTALWRVLERSEQIAEKTEGAFDVTLGPLTNLWRRSRRQGELPTAQTLAEARAVAGYRKMVLEPRARTVTLSVPGMRLDVGGIAKGYAADEAMVVLAGKGLTRALVAASGDIVAGDPPPGQRGWRVEISTLPLPGAPPPEVLLLARQGVSTSGDAYQFVEIEGVRYSHVVNPRTGLGMTDRSLVTVVAPDGLTADGLDTAVDVLGPERGAALVAGMAGVEMRMLRAPGEKVEEHETAGWKKLPRP